MAPPSGLGAGAKNCFILVKRFKKPSRQKDRAVKSLLSTALPYPDLVEQVTPLRKWAPLPEQALLLRVQQKPPAR